MKSADPLLAHPKYAWAAIDRCPPPQRSVRERMADFCEVEQTLEPGIAQEQATRCIQCPQPPCVEGCPLHNRIPEWLRLAAEGEFLSAAEISGETSNFPELCARICPQERLCEGACTLNARSDPVAIGMIERFINEYALAHGAVAARRAPPNGCHVAIVGSGPGGIACADQLAKRGYNVTIFESQPVPGGLLVNGIPAFKLDKRAVARRIELLRARGVRFSLGVAVGRDITLAGLRRGFDAVFLGFGAQRPKPLDLPGAEMPGVVRALDFLVQKNSPQACALGPIAVAGKRVAVLGGSDTAMDCLRTALRCGAAEAVCIYRRDAGNMPGSRKEFKQSQEEGARFEFLANPVELVAGSDGSVAGVKCVRMELGNPDASGRRSPRPVPGSEFTVPADILIVAYGFDPVPFDSGDPSQSLATDRWGSLRVDENQMTNLDGVFAGGDSVRGPSLVSHAAADGRKAAEGIHRYVQSRKG